MVYKKSFITFIFFLLAAAAQAQLIPVDSLKILVQQHLDNEEKPEEWYMVGDDETEMTESESAALLDSAIAIAQQDYSAGGFKFYYNAWHETNTLNRLLESRYAVSFYYDDSVDYSTYHYKYYYNACMKVLLKQKYGWNIFQKLFIESQKMDATGQGDRWLNFEGGRVAAEKAIYCNINYYGFNDESSSRPLIGVYLHYTADGVLDSVRVNDITKPGSETALNGFEKEVVKALAKLPPVVHATQNGLPVEGTFYIDIDYSSGKREEYGCE